MTKRPKISTTGGSRSVKLLFDFGLIVFGDPTELIGYNSEKRRKSKEYYDNRGRKNG